MINEYHSAETISAPLPFLVEGQWLPDRTGDYEQDCAAGRSKALQLLTTIEETQNPALFGTVIRAMVAAGTYEGTEIGFCSRVGIYIAGTSVA
jgi:hypothetical protein